MSQVVTATNQPGQEEFSLFCQNSHALSISKTAVYYLDPSLPDPNPLSLFGGENAWYW
jgi:hypothetical protein